MNLYDPGTLKAFLGRHGLSASKGLGQHFLISKVVVDRIVEAVRHCSGVCEIGPGPGVLTGPISAIVRRVIAVELDDRMVSALQESAPGADVRRLDALKVELSALLRELPEPRAVVSNLPYYITGPLLTRIAEARREFSVAVLMMQREVAVRVVAPASGSARGSLSVFLQAQFQIRVIAQVPAGAFYPPPKVESTVLELTPKATGLSEEEERRFFKLVRIGFTQPRKTLANNLTGLGITRDVSLSAIAKCGFDPRIRPQQMDLAQWYALCEALGTTLEGDGA